MNRVPFATAATVLNVLAVFSGLVTAGRVGAEHPERAASVAANRSPETENGIRRTGRDCRRDRDSPDSLVPRDCCLWPGHVRRTCLAGESRAGVQRREQDAGTRARSTAAHRRRGGGDDPAHRMENPTSGIPASGSSRRRLRGSRETRQVPKTSYFTMWTNRKSVHIRRQSYLVDRDCPAVGGWRRVRRLRDSSHEAS